VQLRALLANGRGVESRYRVTGSVRFACAPPPQQRQLQREAESVLARAEAMLRTADHAADTPAAFAAAVA
jgi:hypothetical protein